MRHHTTPPTTHQLYTPAQVAELFQVHKYTVYEWLRKGRLQGRKIGGVWRVSSVDLTKLEGSK